MQSITYKNENNRQLPKSNKVLIQIKKEENEEINNSTLDASIQRFNPSTSPPMNDFMDRLIARKLSYEGK